MLTSPWSLPPMVLALALVVGPAHKASAQPAPLPTPAPEVSPMPRELPTLHAWQMVVDGQNFPEGPAWDGHSSLYFSNCNGGTVMRITHGQPGASVFASAAADPAPFGKTNGLTIGADGAVYACDYGTPSVVRLGLDGSARVLARACDDGTAFIRPNDLAFDPQGNLYVTDSWAYEREDPQGAVYRIDAATGAVSRARGGLAFPNGLAFSADARTLYVAESACERVLKFAVADDGSLGEPTVFADMPGGDPDGMAVDIDGNLYVAHFGGGAVVVFGPDGRERHRLPTPGRKPSNVEFAGADRRTLYITEDETNAVYRTEVEVPGLALFRGPRP